MGTPATFRAGRPASILIAICLLAAASWLGLVPRDSLDHSISDGGKPSPTSRTIPEWREAAADQGVPAHRPQSFEDVSPLNAPADAVERAASSDLLYGLLQETSGREYVSPAGLIYGPGSAEGHRLDHLRRHTEDDRGRGGSHGVFDGGMAGALKTVDLAYERAKAGQRTTSKEDDGRMIHTVDLGKRIGYVGGSEGQRRGHPMARRVRLVLEGNHVITAFPM